MYSGTPARGASWYAWLTCLGDEIEFDSADKESPTSGPLERKNEDDIEDALVPLDLWFVNFVNDFVEALRVRCGCIASLGGDDEDLAPSLSRVLRVLMAECWKGDDVRPREEVDSLLLPPPSRLARSFFLLLPLLLLLDLLLLGDEALCP